MSAGVRWSFNTNRLTEKSIEAINAAQSLPSATATARSSPSILLLALLEQGDGVVPQVLGKLNIACWRAWPSRCAPSSGKFPRVSGGSVQVGVSNRLRSVLVKAHDERAQFGDEYVSTEHLLLATLALMPAARPSAC
ncbi:MAG: Clp protease N-terminal domain-containing protein [Kouleothrix sp.]